MIGGRPRPTPVLKFFSYLVPKESVSLRIETSEGEVVDCAPPGVPPGGWGTYEEKKPKESSAPVANSSGKSNFKKIMHIANV